MKTVDKNDLLNRLAKQVEAHIQLVTQSFSDQNESVLLLAAPNGGWSVAQCLEHLNSYGYFYLPEIENSLNRNDTTADHGTFTSSWLGAWFTRMMDPATGKKKYKAFKGHSPAADLDAKAVVQEYLRQQTQMLLFLERAKKVNLRRSKVPMSIARWVTLPLGDVFQFMIAHDERHLKQAGRNTGEEK